MLTRVEMALLTIPPDLVSALVAYGAESAFIWTGSRPQSDSDFYFELGRKINHLTTKAWDSELQAVPKRNDEWPLE